mgnify:CR=1 FL=1
MEARSKLKMIFLYIVLCLFILFALFPIYWAIITSFKAPSEIFSKVPTFFPKKFSFEGYATLFLKTDYPVNLMNSLTVSLIVSFLSVFASMLAAYAIARLNFRGRGAMSRSMFYAYIMPKTLLFIPIYILITTINLDNSIWGLIFIYPTLTIPYATWILASYFKTIPYEIEEAAIVDGCSRLKSMFRIIFPLSVPGIISTFIFSISICWSEYLYALIIINRSYQKTVSLALADMIVGDYVAWGPLMGGAVISTIPITILYMLFSRFLVGGMVAGGVKG